MFHEDETRDPKKPEAEPSELRWQTEAGRRSAASRKGARTRKRMEQARKLAATSDGEKTC
jgi:hypothetical protein